MPRYVAMRKAIERCHSVDEIEKIIPTDLKKAMRLYTIMCEDKSTREKFGEIYLRAERRKGELLIEIRSATEYIPAAPVDSSKAKQQRISENIRIANIPKAEFEREVKRPGASKRKLLDYARQKTKSKPRVSKPKASKPKSESEQMSYLAAAIYEVRKGLERAVKGMKHRDMAMNEILDKEGLISQMHITAGIFADLMLIKKYLETLEPLMSRTNGASKNNNENLPAVIH